jgi:hypothetical protein
VVDAPSRTVTWANGGLHPPLWVRPGDGVHALPGGDLILGVESETRYREHTVHLVPGESVVMLTDGILDARSGNEDFGTSLLPECRVAGRMARTSPARPPLTEARAFHRRCGRRHDRGGAAGDVVGQTQQRTPPHCGGRIHELAPRAARETFHK